MAKPSPAQLRRSGVQAFMGSGVRGSGGGSGYQGITKRVRRYKGVRGSWVQGSGGHRGYKGIRGSGGGSGCQKIRGQGVYKGFIGSGVHGFRGQEVMGSGGQGVKGSCIMHQATRPPGHQKDIHLAEAIINSYSSVFSGLRNR